MNHYDREDDAFEEAGERGEQDAGANKPPCAEAWGFHGELATVYNRAHRHEVTRLIGIEERKRAQPISEETAELIRQSLTIFTLGTVKQPIRFPGQRYQVRHYSRQNCVLNPEDSGFPDYDTAALERDHLLEAGLEVGDYVTIEDQGCIIELHEHKPNTEGESR